MKDKKKQTHTQTHIQLTHWHLWALTVIFIFPFMLVDDKYGRLVLYAFVHSKKQKYGKRFYCHHVIKLYKIRSGIHKYVGKYHLRSITAVESIEIDGAHRRSILVFV